MKLVRLFAFAVAVAAPSYLLGQAGITPEYQKLMDSFTAAYNKGDGAGVAAHYVEKAVRVGPDGSVQSSRAAIQETYSQYLAGPFKGAKIALTASEMRELTPDVRVVVGTFDITGASVGPLSGKYVNTLVREGGQWKIAATAALRPVTATPPGSK